ncbi:MAG: hypothetical protein LBM01_02165 [Christensenellaceae bacterium]|jgi:hypothetical protein|nr:hypothetical protein [Christensenellaceae bacterium]
MLNEVSLLIVVLASSAFILFLIVCAFFPIGAGAFLTIRTEADERTREKKKRKVKFAPADDDIIFDDDEL